MTQLTELLAQPGETLICGAPEGLDALVLAELAGPKRPDILHICQDDRRMALFRATLAFFAPKIEVLSFPAWDCLPYDRVSPNGETVSRRIETLTRLSAGLERGAKPRDGRIVLTTVNAATQRVPPRRMFRDRALAVKAGEKVGIARLLVFLTANGYHRTETVREAGEFALRGGIVDLFPTGMPEPLRLDFFGDVVEEIRQFDPMTQRSTTRLDNVEFKPVSEVLLDPEAISLFRTRYRDQFGAVAQEDGLYEAVSDGRRHIGMEHWLPLFHKELDTLFDYLPGAIVTFDPHAEEVRASRNESIAEFYDARKSLTASRNADPATVYKPVLPTQMFVDDKEWKATLALRSIARLTPFPPPPEYPGKSYDAGGRPGLSFAEARTNPKLNPFEVLRDRVGEQKAAGRKVALAAFTEGSADRLRHVLAERGVTDVERAADWAALQALPKHQLGLVVLPLEAGFQTGKLTLISEQDVLGERLARPARKRRNAEKFIAEASSLGVGDLVVHREHGIGRYEGLETLGIGGGAHDCLKVVYQGDDKLYVPVENIEVLSRYGSDSAEATLDRLGGASWQARHARVKQRIKDIAADLIKVAAERALKEGETLAPPEGLYDEFAARFPYPETDDQLSAITDTLSDMGSGRPMDRLICGDVGFGKTEVALRAAFVAAMSGVQVAVVVPTTLLCRQHFRNFTQRFAGLPLQVAQLSRLVGSKETTEIKKGLAEGTVDLVVGTHALLSKGISFKNLGLLIVDEEQHFGVTQKERLKQLRADVHVLTLTATPIPRTLQMALAGVREMSLIATAPIDRLAVRTFVLPFDPVVVREAIQRERHRGGQIFYVVPRLSDLDEVREQLRELVPEVKVAMAHGRMAASDLEEVMQEFDAGRYDLLLATNIIESGLDIPAANTLIVHRSDMFGLAQLYQLRGRVGRGKVRAYAYLTVPPGKALSATAMRRLEVLQTLDTLGAGFQLASHDLDIRGAGNLLGDEQSGHVREVGIELYQQLLEDAVAEARVRSKLAEGEKAKALPQDDWTPQIALGIAILIPETYVADLGLRLGLYRRLPDLKERRDIDAFAAELVDRFGPLPQEVENLLQIVGIKLLCRAAGVENVDAGPKGVVLTFHQNKFANPAKLVELIQKESPSMRVRPDQKLVWIRDLEVAKLRVAAVEQVLTRLAAFVNAADKDGAPAAALPPPTPVVVKKPAPHKPFGSGHYMRPGRFRR